MTLEVKRIDTSESHYVIDLFDSYRVFYKQPSDKILAKEFINQRLCNNESVIFVALIEKDQQITPVGFTQLYPKYSSMRATKNWILNDLYVDEKFRKNGIGEELIKTAMNFAKDTGATFVQLETANNNYTAQKLYEAIGFTKQEAENEFIVYRIKLT